MDSLYEPILQELKIPYIKTEWHRYAADLNRLSTDVDQESVEGVENPAGTFPRGFHWVYSTQGEKILHKPLSLKTHQQLVKRVYEPFHRSIQDTVDSLKQTGIIYHLDLHSMPSVGTNQHRDPGEFRKEVVISDSKGKSCSPKLKQIVENSFKQEGFSLAYNWPYFGGRLTEHYGHPENDHHVIQIELNRSLYMDEKTKKLLPQWQTLQVRLNQVIRRIFNELTQNN